MMPLALRNLELLTECDDNVAYGVAPSGDLREQPSSNIGLDPLSYRLGDGSPGKLNNGVLGHRNLLEPSFSIGVGSKQNWKLDVSSNQEVRDFWGFWAARTRLLEVDSLWH